MSHSNIIYFYRRFIYTYYYLYLYMRIKNKLIFFLNDIQSCYIHSIDKQTKKATKK